MDQWSEGNGVARHLNFKEDGLHLTSGLPTTSLDTPPGTSEPGNAKDEAFSKRDKGAKAKKRKGTVIKRAKHSEISNEAEFYNELPSEWRNGATEPLDDLLEINDLHRQFVEDHVSALAESHATSEREENTDTKDAMHDNDNAEDGEDDGEEEEEAEAPAHMESDEEMPEWADDEAPLSSNTGGM